MATATPKSGSSQRLKMRCPITKNDDEQQQAVAKLR